MPFDCDLQTIRDVLDVLCFTQEDRYEEEDWGENTHIRFPDGQTYLFQEPDESAYPVGFFIVTRGSGRRGATGAIAIASDGSLWRKRGGLEIGWRKKLEAMGALVLHSE